MATWEYAAYVLVALAGTLALRRFLRLPSLDRARLTKTLLAVAIPFVLWDALAVSRGHWSFSTAHVLGVFVGNQPVEELAFFLVAPFFYLTLWQALSAQGEGEKPK